MGEREKKGRKKEKKNRLWKQTPWSFVQAGASPYIRRIKNIVCGNTRSCYTSNDICLLVHVAHFDSVISHCDLCVCLPRVVLLSLLFWFCFAFLHCKTSVWQCTNGHFVHEWTLCIFLFNVYCIFFFCYVLYSVCSVVEKGTHIPM